MTATVFSPGVWATGAGLIHMAVPVPMVHAAVSHHCIMFGDSNSYCGIKKTFYVVILFKYTSVEGGHTAVMRDQLFANILQLWHLFTHTYGGADKYLTPPTRSLPSLLLFMIAAAHMCQCDSVCLFSSVSSLHNRPSLFL